MTLEAVISNPRTQREREIAELGPWFHNLHLPDGTQTAPDHPLGNFPQFKWQKILPYLDADLTGLSALDIGCNAGFYTFELARRGASVLGIDIDEHYLRQARWAAGQFDFRDRVNFLKMQVYDIGVQARSYDIIVFMGVFYHLRHPLPALDIVSARFKKFMIFQTLTMPGDDVFSVPADLEIEDRDLMLEPGWPKMAFIENNLAGDPTNWWAPNHAAVEAILRSSGLEIFARPDHEIYICSRDKPCRTDSEFVCETASALRSIF